MEQLVCVPDIGSFKDVEVIEILVSPGDVISENDGLITLESDKAAMEIPSPLAGKVIALELQVGTRVSQGSPILKLELAEAGAAAAAPAPAGPAVAAPAAVAPAPVATPVPAAPAQAPEVKVPTAPPAPSVQAPVAVGGGAPPHASPAVRRFARELGADLGEVRGSGPKGRILKSDIQGYIKQRLQQPQGVAGGSIAGFPGIIQGPTPESLAAYGEVSVQPLSRIQRLSATHLHRCWTTAPQVTQFEEADITDMDAFRISLKAEAEREGVKLTLLPFVIRALVSTLKAYPRFNASLAADGQSLITKSYFNIGVAVDTPDGLLVPVIRNADRMGIFEIARTLADFGAQARAQKLKPDLLQGGSFTLSSLGGIGGTAFTPIVNVPEVAILGLSRTQTRPVWQDGQWVPRLMLPISLSYDHRVIDGVAGARFTGHLARELADIRRLLL
jgi:pyruvate dehydrogenase E2 component (dihydrolipoamide acetyltransferase)